MAVRQSTAAKSGDAITVLELNVGVATCLIRGTSPLIFNRMAEKAKRELLLPKGRKTAADKAQSLKHDPIAEFQASVYRHADDAQPTRLKFPAPGFKALLQTAALEVPGARKSQIGRLTWVQGTHVNVFGRPQLLMSVVRSADIGKTPDIRTRAIISDWCCEVTLSFTQPTLNSQTVATLLAAGGLICGIGDFRQEKGSGNHGQYILVDENDEGFNKIVREGGRAVQDEALEVPEPFDEESAELLHWYQTEVLARGRKAA